LTVASRTVTVNQSPGCSFSISPSSLSVGAAGGNNTVQVETQQGCAWTASSGASWISITDGTSGTGRGAAQLTVAANVGPARNGSVTLAGQTVTVAQASGCTFTVSPLTQDLAGTGGSATASVTTVEGCTWNARSSADWLTVGTASGSGSAQVSFSAGANMTPPRTGSLTIAGRTVTVNQASVCAWSFVPPFHQFDANGGNGNVLVFVSGACSWTATTTFDWIHLTAGTSAVGGALLQFVVDPNPGAARTGFIALGGQNYEVREGGR
jgi:hypothetical protein